MDKSNNWDDEKNVQIGEHYKCDEGYWLVPAFNKNTGEFIGAVWIGADFHKNSDGSFSHGFINGPDSYSVYKDIISGKEVDSGGRDFSYDPRVLRSLRKHLMLIPIRYWWNQNRYQI